MSSITSVNLIDMDESPLLKNAPSASTSTKRKRKKLPPQERRRRRKIFEEKQQISTYRNGVRRNRLVQAASKLAYNSDAINASENFLLTIANDACNKLLVDDIRRDIKILIGRKLRLEFEYESAKGLTSSKRCSRKRNKSGRTNDKYVQTLIRMRRNNRHSNVPQSNKVGTELSQVLSDLDSDSDVSIDSEVDDETYVPEVNLGHGKSRRRRNHFKRGKNEEALADKEDVFSEEYDSLKSKFQFAIDLKNKDIRPAFKDQWLVGLEFKQSHVASRTWAEIRSMKKADVVSTFGNSKIVVCKRNPTGQVYSANGFRDMVHFTVGSEGKKQLCSFLNQNSIKYYELRGYESDMPSPDWFNVISMPKSSTDNPSDFLSTMNSKMNDLGKAFIPHLMKTTVSSSERVKRCINLGITDQRCDQYEVINLVRNIKPSLISLTTATRDLDSESLSILADTILYAERNYIKQFRKGLDTDNAWCNELYAKFARQLGLEDEEDIRDFKIAGLAIMLADDLHPHLDAMNPKGIDDLTVQFNFQIDIDELDDECQKKVRLAFGDDIQSLPFTLILYPRRCLINYGKRLQAISDFPNQCEKEKKGRDKLVSVLGNVGSTLDFNSRCLTSSGYARRVDELNHVDGQKEYITSKAAIDKMSWYSAILNWFVLHACHEGIDVIGSLQIILFFCHQCNNTLTFSRAFSQIISERETQLKSNPKKVKKINDYYDLLGKTCYQIRKPEIVANKVSKDKTGTPKEDVRDQILREYPSYEESTDVGNGLHPRFVTSNTPVLSPAKVNETVEFLLTLCNEMNERTKRSNRDEECLHLVEFFALKCQDIPGIGPLKSQMMIQLCALFGLVPMEYYTFLPMHLKGGPGVFMTEEMGWDKSVDKNLLEWNVGIVSQMQLLYNKEFTYNFFENATCEISRSHPPDDLYFEVPSIDEDVKMKNRLSLCFENKRLQFFFRVDGNRCNNWKLQIYAGGKNKINLYPVNNQRGSSLMEWTRAQSNGRLARSTKIRVNLKYLWTLDNSRPVLSSNK